MVRQAHHEVLEKLTMRGFDKLTTGINSLKVLGLILSLSKPHPEPVEASPGHVEDLILSLSKPHPEPVEASS